MHGPSTPSDVFLLTEAAIFLVICEAQYYKWVKEFRALKIGTSLQRSHPIQMLFKNGRRGEVMVLLSWAKYKLM